MFDMIKQNPPRALTIAHAHHVRRNPHMFDAQTMAEADAAISAEVRETYAIRHSGDASFAPVIHGKLTPIAQIRPVPTPHKASRSKAASPPRVWPFQALIGLAIAGGALIFVNAVWSAIMFFTAGW